MPQRRKFLVVLVTCPNQRQATQLANRLLQKRLAACVNILPGVQSLFWWEGKIDQAKEILLVIKTRSTHFERLRRAVLAEHPYDVPEVIALPIEQGHPPYLQWLHEALIVS